MTQFIASARIRMVMIFYALETRKQLVKIKSRTARLSSTPFIIEINLIIFRAKKPLSFEST